jgi:hypothetical protein
MEPIEFHFPCAGIDVTQPVGRQPARETYNKRYARTTARGVNVRGFDYLNRFRGGMRCGLSKYVPGRPGDTFYITQLLDVMVTTSGSPVQPSQSGRLVILIGVSQGNVYTLPAGDTTWNTAGNTSGNTPALNVTGLMQSASNNQLEFFADGTNQCYYDPVSDSVKAWTPTSGSFPVDSGGNKPRLICTWRGRTVLSGLLLDPSVIFMTKVSDPFNFNYAPTVPIPLDSAWSGHTGPQGETGDVVNALIPYTDDLMVVGGDSSISIFRGDPMAGGSIDNSVSDYGIAWGKAWCFDSQGILYFFSSRSGVFMMSPTAGNNPQRISQSIDPLLETIDSGQYAIRMAWDDRFKNLHVFITLLTAPAATTHYCWEARSNAWWQDEFLDPNMNPLTVVTFDGNLPNDRVVLLGSWDGYVRAIDFDASTDDGQIINSEVLTGPFLTKFNDDVKINELQTVLGKDSADVAFSVLIGKTAEQALISSPVKQGTWTAGRNFTNLIQRSANALYVKETSTGRWAKETTRVMIDSQGKVRQRGNANG